MARDGWIEGVAVIRDSDRIGDEPADDGEPWPWEIPLNVIGSRKYDLTLEVTVPARESYLVSGRFTVLMDPADADAARATLAGA